MLNPAIDVDTLKGELHRHGRIQIADCLDTDVAERLHQCLREDIPWRLSCYDNTLDGADKALKIPQERLATMTREQQAGFQQEILRQARDQFQYVYQSFDLLAGHRAGERPELFVYELMKYLAGDDFFSFARELTGDAEIDLIDGHATRYVAGNFLKDHSDESPLEHRRFAYVIGMTRDWDADMGGMTQFLDEAGNVVDSYLPTFNSLLLFSVPVRHLVSYVPVWVAGERLSVTGWLTAGPSL